MSRIEVVPLDPATLRACAEIARQSANGIPRIRSHYTVASATLRVLAETFEDLAGKK